MASDHRVRSFDYVNHPYEQVRDALIEGALELFRAATRSAESRAESLAAELRVKVGAVDIGTEIDIVVKEVEQQPSQPGSGPWTRLHLKWASSRSPRLFPLMHAELTVYPLTGSETQLDFSGQYDPPGGIVGSAVDTVLGHRLAEASVHRFVADVATHLRQTLS